ncbi:ATP-dependent helicase [Neobacillus cucumis]|uniref:ATP-dependent helicase n=1 Tax=Neobacillus cucumis TaxID=1740721 RepID=UPI0018E03837|nr:ATP-dependent DNA helicase [Neobacillus cucumis]MBI0578602.1 ATP-dependent helicase [Neobacillus cucumis]
MVKVVPNEAQEEAITTIEGPVLISAGPGTGKTATLVNRYANMVTNHGINPENILMATFTEKAAKEIVTRISSLIPDFDLNDVYIGTFHSICLRIVRDNLAFIPNLKKSFTLMDDFDQKYFIYQNFNYGFGKQPHFNALPFGNRGIWDKSSILADFLNGLAEEQINPSELLMDTDPQIVALGEAKLFYDELLEKNNRLDFATIQATAFELLNNNSEVLAEYQSLFQYMMIDEYQDTNAIQERLIFLLSKTKNICVVGDDDQSMYRFRGATIRNILEFTSKFPTETCKEITLTTNYRSAPEIIGFYNKWMTDYSEEFFDWDKFRIEKHIVPSEDKNYKSLTPPVLKVYGDTLEKWAERVRDFLLRLMENGDITNYNQVAFLFRSVSNNNAKFLANYLEENGIPIYSPRSKMFFERAEIKAVIGIMLHLFSDYEEKILEDDAEWFHDMVKYYESCLDISFEIMDEDSDLEEWVSYRMKELSNLKGNTDYAFTRLLYQLFTFDYFKEIIDTDLSSGVADQRAIRNLAILTNIFAKFESIERVEVISSEKKVNTLNKLFRTYFRFLMQGGIEEYQDESEYAPSGCVSFMTIHQSKGMEFPIVITDSLYDIPRKDNTTLLNEVYNQYSDRNNFEPEDEIKYFDFWRRYYVAFSRAEDLLVLTTPIKETGQSQAPSKSFSTAWNEIADYHEKNWSFEEFNFKPVKSSNLKQSYAFTSDISKYERCSIEYKIFRELGFSEIRIGSTLFGSLVHQTIEDVHDAILRNETESIETNLENWFENNYQGLALSEHSYLAPNSKAAAMRYVKNYFENSREMWENIRESEVRLSYPMKDFILNGCIDMLKGKGDTVEIVDFKTGDKPTSMTDEMLQSYEKQLQVYAHLVEEKYGVEVSKMKLYYLSEADNPIISFDKDVKKIEEMMVEFADVVHKIEANDYSTRTSDPSHCAECDLRYYCKRSSPIK